FASRNAFTKKRSSVKLAPIVLGVLLACMGLSYGLSAPQSPMHFSFLGAASNVAEAKPAMTAPAPPFVVGPSISATKTHSPSGPFHLGDTITYSTTISNGGSDATGVTFSDTPDANTTLVNGSIKASPVAVDDSYTATGGLSISIPAGSGVLANDFLGLNPVGTITASYATSANGGDPSLVRGPGVYLPTPARLTRPPT